MKKFLCLLLCLMLCVSSALAAEVTPARKFRNQVITGGSGIKGTLSLTASGAAEWLQYVLPFTADELQVRIIGQAQGKYSDTNPEDDNWQMKVYAEDAAGAPYGTTYLYGDPNSLYLLSELLPGELLTLPAKNAHVPYGILDGEVMSLLMSLDPIGLFSAPKTGNVTAYSALTNLLEVSEEEWAEKWLPVLDKYYTEMDMWLSSYGGAPVVSGGTGSLTMQSSYVIPGEEVKNQAKKVIGMLLYDNELMALLAPYFTQGQKAFYLNPNMVYVYEYAIDMLPLNGNVVLKSELTAMGETVGMSVSLPLPKLPAEVTQPINELLASAFQLPYADVLNNIERITFSKDETATSISASSPARTISLVIDEADATEEAAHMSGFLRIDPAAGTTEAPLAASFTYATAHGVTTDEDEAIHDDTTITLSIVPDIAALDADDPFRSSYIDFSPLGIDMTMNYFTKTPRAESATRLEMAGKLYLPDAEIGFDADLRTTSSWAHEDLPVGGEDVLLLSDARKAELLETFAQNAVQTMIQSIAQPETAPEAAPEATEAPAPTNVPPVV